jgi:hypothetical protein
MILVEEKDNRFHIAESTQKDAGLGLFASVDIEEGSDLEVVGVVVDKGSPADLCTAYSDSYKFAADYSDAFTRHIIPMGYAGMVNHANDEKDKNVEIKYVKKNGKTVCVYRFIRGVSKGQEILGDYGEGWRTLAEWSRSVVEKADESEEREWHAFLDLNLYSLGKLKKPGGSDAEHK